MPKRLTVEVQAYKLDTVLNDPKYDDYRLVGMCTVQRNRPFSHGDEKDPAKVELHRKEPKIEVLLIVFEKIS